MRWGVKLAIKCVVTALMLWVAFRTVDVGAVPRLLAGANPWWAAVALLLTVFIILSDAVLLTAVMRMFERRVTFGTAVLYSLVSWFFSNVAPSTVGGDVFRGIQLSRVGTPVGAAVRVVLTIRLLSLATLVAVMAVGFPIALDLIEDRSATIILSGTLMAAAAGVAALLLLAPMSRILPALERWPLLQKVTTVSSDFRKLLAPRSQCALSWSSALAQHVLRVSVLASLAAGLGLGIPFATLFALAPAALLIAMVPISFGGWGVREVTFVYILGAADVSAEAALSLSVVFGLLRALVGALGGLTWVLLEDGHFRVDVPPA